MDSNGPITRRAVLAGLVAVSAGCAGTEPSDDDNGGGTDGSGDDTATDDTNDSGTGTTDDDSSDGTDDSSTATSGDDTATDSGTGTTTTPTNPALGDVSRRDDLSLTSPAFADGEQIPLEYGYGERNVNPPLRIDGVPEEAQSLALVVDDPDAVEPAGKVWDHWIVWNVAPDRREIPAGWEPEAANEGTNDFGNVGYDGPSPPDEAHRYRFKLFALGTTLDLPSETDARALGEAMVGHVLAAAQLDGTYPA